MKASRNVRRGIWIVAVSVGLWQAPLFGQKPIELKGHKAGIHSIAFAPDGKTLASGSIDGTIKLWNTKTWKATRTIKIRAVTAVAFSPDGRRFAAATYNDATNQYSITLWDAKTWKVKGAFKGQADVILSLAFSPDSTKIASGRMDGTITLWKVKTGELIRRLKEPPDEGLAVKFSPDGKTLVSYGESIPIKLWDVKTGESKWTRTGSYPCFAFSPDGRTFAVAADTAIALLDKKTGKVMQLLKRRNYASICLVAFSPDGKTLASCGFQGSARVYLDWTITLWNRKTGKEMRSYTARNQIVESIVFSPDGKTLAWFSKHLRNTVNVWDLKTKKVTPSATGSLPTSATESLTF